MTQKIETKMQDFTAQESDDYFHESYKRIALFVV